MDQTKTLKLELTRAEFFELWGAVLEAQNKVGKEYEKYSIDTNPLDHLKILKQMSVVQNIKMKIESLKDDFVMMDKV